MTPQRTHGDTWVSDDENEEEQADEQQRASAQGSAGPDSKANMARRWKRKLQQLGRMGNPGNTRPGIGQVCLVMTGKVNQDQGQVGVVTSHTPAMVEVTYGRDAGGKLSTM